MAAEWSWHDENGLEATVVPSVQAIAVYENPRGDVVIRQQGSMGEDDAFVHIPRSMLTIIINALKAELHREQLSEE